YAADKKIKTARRKQLQPKLRAVRKQLKKQISKAEPEEAEQLAVLDEYAAGTVTASPHGWAAALHLCGSGSRPGLRRGRSQRGRGWKKRGCGEPTGGPEASAAASD